MTAALRVVFLAGPVGSDDTRYMDAAWKLAHGEAPGVLDHAYVRAAYIVWLALWTRMGAGGSALVVSQVVVNVLLVLAIYWLGRRLTGDWRAAILGALCWALFPIELTYGGIVVPDQFAVLLALLAAGAAIAALRAPSGSGRLALAGAGALAGLAVSVKEPYVLLPVIFGLWALWDIRPRRLAISRVVAIGAIALCTFALEYAFFRLWTGDWLYRHRALHQVYGPGGAITAEVTWSPGMSIYYLREVIFNPAESGLFGWLLLIAAVRAMPAIRESRFIALWSVAFFAFLQFGSTTLVRYQPLPMQPRYVQPMLVLLFIPLGLWLTALARSTAFGRVGAALLLAGVTTQGIMAAQVSSAHGLFLDTFPRAVERTLAMQARGSIGRVALPEVVSRRLPPDLRERTDAWPKLALKDGATAGELERLRHDSIALLIPNDLFKLPSPRGDYRALQTWLGQNARTVPVEDGRTFVDRLWLASALAPLQRRAQSAVIGRLYLFAD